MPYNEYDFYPVSGEIDDIYASDYYDYEDDYLPDDIFDPRTDEW